MKKSEINKLVQDCEQAVLLRKNSIAAIRIIFRNMSEEAREAILKRSTNLRWAWDKLSRGYFGADVSLGKLLAIAKELQTALVDLKS